MTDLSPQAQAIVDAYENTTDKYAALAAVLRATVEQLMYTDHNGDLCINPEYILDIAEELEQF
jgi:hypothetical protein